MDAAKNFAKGTLAGGFDDEALTITLVTGDTARFPAAPFNAVWWNATDYPDPADDPFVEIVRVTTVNGNDFIVTRGQEGTSNITHELEGKVYKIIAPLTAKVINGLPNSTKVGDDCEIASDGNLALEAVGSLTGTGNSFRFASSAAGMVVDISGTVAGLGDVDENNSGAAVLVNDSTGVIGHRGKIGTNQTVAATTLGSVTKKLEIFDNAGNSLGFIPLYGSIT